MGISPLDFETASRNGNWEVVIYEIARMIEEKKAFMTQITVVDDSLDEIMDWFKLGEPWRRRKIRRTILKFEIQFLDE